MAVQHIYTILCDYVFQDANFHRFGFLGVFHNIELAAAPGAIPMFFVVVGIRGEPDDEMEIFIANADRSWQRSLGKHPVPVSETAAAEGKLSFAMVLTQMPNFEFPAPGDYQVLLLSDGQEIHSAPFRVRLRKEPTGDNTS
jgi:hypothetical protein